MLPLPGTAILSQSSSLASTENRKCHKLWGYLLLCPSSTNFTDIHHNLGGFLILLEHPGGKPIYLFINLHFYLSSAFPNLGYTSVLSDVAFVSFVFYCTSDLSTFLYCCDVRGSHSVTTLSFYRPMPHVALSNAVRMTGSRAQCVFWIHSFIENPLPETELNVKLWGFLHFL